MSINKPIQLGLCCINTILRSQNPPVFSSRKMIVKTVKEKGINELKKLIIQNLEDTLILIDWNENNGIKVFRLSSELFPHKTNKLVDDYTFDFAIDLLKEIGRISKIYNQRLTFHPGQYNVVGTQNEECFKQTCIELKYHADILDLMELDHNSVMVVHGGGTYGNKRNTIDRWCHQFTLLPENVKSRLVLENCEKSFSIIDCLEVSERINIPVVFDTHHFECYKRLHPEELHLFEEPANYIERILNTWKRRGIKPKFHVSEQGSGRIGHHSDYINEIPQYLLEIPDKYGVEIDIMIEAKMKEQAILSLYEKYPHLNCKSNKIIKLKIKNKLKKSKIIINTNTSINNSVSMKLRNGKNIKSSGSTFLNIISITNTASICNTITKEPTKETIEMLKSNEAVEIINQAQSVMSISDISNCIIEIKKNGLIWIDKVLEKEITYTKAGSISHLLYGEKPSEQSINIKLGRLGEKLSKDIIKINHRFELLNCGIQKINDKKKDVDLIFKDISNNIIYYRELKGNIELDTEKLPATINKCREIETSLKHKYENCKINCGILNWSVYNRKILKAGLSNIKTFEQAGIKIDHMEDFLRIVNIVWDEEDYYLYFRNIGDKIYKRFT